MTPDAAIEITRRATHVRVIEGSSSESKVIDHTPPGEDGDVDLGVWWEAVQRAWGLLRSSPPATVAVSAPAGAVFLDADGVPLREAMIGACERSRPDAGWLLGQLDGPAWEAAVGAQPTAASTISKLSWLHRSDAAAWERLAHVVSPVDWIVAQMCSLGTDAIVTDPVSAAATGYWHAASGQYRWELLAIVDAGRDWPAMAPPVVAAAEPRGRWNGARVTVSPPGPSQHG